MTPAPIFFKEASKRAANESSSCTFSTVNFACLNTALLSYPNTHKLIVSFCIARKAVKVDVFLEMFVTSSSGLLIIIINNNNLILILRAFHEMIKRALHDFYL